MVQIRVNHFRMNVADTQKFEIPARLFNMLYIFGQASLQIHVDVIAIAQW